MQVPALPDSIAAIARTVLYEGYILWPYRRSALKNQQRWTFGGVFPRAYSQIQPDDAFVMRTECLVTGDAQTSVTVRVRFLQVLDRLIAKLEGSELVFVDDVEIARMRYTRWQEAKEHEIVCPPLELGAVEQPVEVPVQVESGEMREWIGDGDGRAAAVIRRWQAIHGRITLTAQPLDERLYRLAVVITNESQWHGEHRTAVLMRTMVSTHTILQVRRGAFHSLIDPDPACRAAAAECRNTGTWPVLVGEAGSHDAMLSSPIILYDYPQIAPESSGDFFDAGEIDQLLVLSILGMSSAEQQAMAETDAAACAILERCRALSREQLMQLYGATRTMRRID